MDSAEKKMLSEYPLNLIWIIPAQEDYRNTLFEITNLPYYLNAANFLF